MAIGTILKELAVAGGRAAVDAIAKLIRGKARDEWVDVKVTDPPPQPLSHRDVEHQQAQIRSATTPVDRNAITPRPPRRAKPGTLDK